MNKLFLFDLNCKALNSPFSNLSGNTKAVFDITVETKLNTLSYE